MKNISEVINEMKIDDLKNLKFSYSDILSISQHDIDNNHLNYWRWKYCTGEITEDEHISIKDTIQEYMMYKIYSKIFSIKSSQNWCEDISFNCMSDQEYYNFSNEVTDLWLMRPEEFQYEEEFKKIIFTLYLEKKEERFKSIALEFYIKNEAARTYTEQCEDYKSMFLMKREDDPEYKCNYGIEIEKVECSMDENCNTENTENTENTDWITKCFENW